jgi:Mannosyltransferase (PIG-V)
VSTEALAERPPEGAESLVARRLTDHPDSLDDAARQDRGQPTDQHDLRLHRLDLTSGRMVLQAWIASRGLIAVVALVLAVWQGRTLTNMVSNWDVQHFTRLAEGGYYAEPDGTLMAFFPGLPVILSMFLQLGVPVAITGVVLSLICSAVAAVALMRLGGPWAAIIWLFAPTAVFTTVPYTESLFCAVAFWAWERARSDRWLAAATLAAIACSVRVSGLFLVGALFVMIITTRRIGWRTRLGQLAMLAIPMAVIIAFAVYLHWLSGSWTAWYTAQSTGWVRKLTWPWDSFLNTIPAILPGAYADHPWWAAVFRGEMVSMAIGLVVTGWCLARRMWAEASWVGVQVLAFSLSYWFFSVNRATLLWFPLWIMLARWGTWRPRRPAVRVAHRVLVVLAFTLSVVLLLWWSWLFFTGHWAS